MRTKLNTQDEFFKLKPSFSHMPGLTLGATDSGHQVFFGHDGSKFIAVKPYEGPNAYDRAMYEKHMLEYIRKAGFLTLKPLRVEQNRTGSVAYLLTNYEPDLMTMSAVVQQRSRAVPPLLTGTAEMLGRLHAAGISHGDAQIKNFGIIPSFGITVIDPEKGGNPDDGHIKNEPFQHDIDSLVQSLAYKGYGGTNTGRAAEAVLDEVLDPYKFAAAPGLGMEMAEQLAYNALNAHMSKHNELYGARQTHV